MPSQNVLRSIPVIIVVCLFALSLTPPAALAKETERDNKKKTQVAPKVQKEEPRQTAPANTAQNTDRKAKPASTPVTTPIPATVTKDAAVVTPSLPAIPDALTRDIQAGEQIRWQVISSGGSMNGASTNYRMSGTIGQTAVGVGTSANYKINQGFWQDFSAGSEPSCCVGETGDVNSDGNRTLTDLTQLVNYLFVTFVAPACPTAANTNGDAACAITLTDLTRLVNRLFVTFVACEPCASFDNSLCP